MHLYPLLLAVATLLNAAGAGYVFAQSPDRRAGQLLALLLLAAAWWSGCSLLWNLSDEAADARFFMQLAAPGWLAVGALLPHIIFHSLDAGSPSLFRRWRKLQANVTATGYALAAVAGALVFEGDLTVGHVFRVPWGFEFVPGPAYFASYASAAVGVALSCFVLARSVVYVSAAETRQLPWMWLAIGTPTSVIVVTEVLLPALELSFPRLGSLSLAPVGPIVVFTILHFGVTMITPPRFGEQILETLGDGVALVNDAGRIRRANRALADLCGREPDALVGMPLSEILDPDLGDDAQTRDLRRELIHSGGSRIPVAVSKGVLRERQNNELGVVAVVRDLRELEDLRRISLTNARLAAVGELAAGLAHEINNPVAFVGSNLRMLRDHWQKLMDGEPGSVPDDERELLVGEGRDLIAESIEGVERAAEIVRGVRNFTHAGSSERTPARLEDLIEDCLLMVRPQVGPGVRLSVERGAVPAVPCSPQELKQVFLNLLINAVHAVGARGSIRISTATSGGMAVVSFADDGHGIAPEIMDRIFDPFFTTKPVGEGTGLGLGIAHQVVSQHGGAITVQSQPGEGATFRVHLPLRDVRGEPAA